MPDEPPDDAVLPGTPPPTWRCFSTPESANNGEISVLAIVETLLAMGISTWIAVHYDTFLYMAVGVSVAPLLLLRTEESTSLGIRYFNGYISSGDSSYTIFRLILFLFVPIGALIIRAFVLFATVVRHPILSVRSIPYNWFRVAFCIDVRHPPELVAGMEDDERLRDAGIFLERGRKVLRFSDVWTVSTKESVPEETWLERVAIDFIVIIVTFPIVGGPGFLLALIYRWSLKASTLIYAPLVWVVHSTFTGDSLQVRLTTICRTALHRITRYYSLLVFLALAAKMVVYVSWVQTAAWWNSLAVVDLLDLFAQPTKIPAWQVASLINCLLTWGLFLFADMALLRIKESEAWPESIVDRTVRTITFVRGLLSLYTIACLLYLVIQAALLFSPPPWDFVLFPWS